MSLNEYRAPTLVKLMTTFCSQTSINDCEMKSSGRHICSLKRKFCGSFSIVDWRLCTYKKYLTRTPEGNGVS